MFKHGSNKRTFRQNLRLAVFLSFTAGLVNICGVLTLGVLTTNVTGHFAYFTQAIHGRNHSYAFIYLCYILAFLIGSFVSTMMTEYFILRESRLAHRPAVLLEITILIIVGIYGDRFIKTGLHREFTACVLLFTMGLQNALVTRISNASVRTTHLTGLFTDLGIELSQLFFYREHIQQDRLKKSIGLRGAIIAFFFSGCIVGGTVFLKIGLTTLLIASVVLIIALLYDHIRVSLFRFKRKIRR